MANTKPMKPTARTAGIGGLLGICLIGTGVWFVLRPPAIPQPPPGVEPLRWLPLEGTVNARDIGGYKTSDGRAVRWNLVYRSDALADVTEDGCETFRKLGIKVVVDYRNRVVSSPLFGGDRECIHQAAQVVLRRVKAVKSPERPTSVATADADKDAFRQPFEFLAEPTSPPHRPPSAWQETQSSLWAATHLPSPQHLPQSVEQLEQSS